MKKFISVLCAVSILLSASAFAFAAEEAIYAAPDGSPQGEGTERSPLTLEAAKEKLKTSNCSKVILKGGEYKLSSPLVFNDEDKDNVTFCSADRETAIITGAFPVSGFEETVLNGVRAFEASANGKNITALFKKETKLKASRYPENGFFYVKSVDDSDNYWTEIKSDNPQDSGSHSFFGETGDISFEPSNVSDVSVYVLHLWQEELSAVTYVEPRSGKVGLKKYTSHKINSGDRYFFTNVKDTLRSSGEWCFDSKEDKIYYIPFDGETIDNIELSASYNSKLIRIENCNGIKFNKVVFENTAMEYADKSKYASLNIHAYAAPNEIDIDIPQAGTDICAAIDVAASKNIAFDRCEFLNIGCSAVKFGDGAVKCSVVNSYFDNIGASAVFAGGKNNEAECSSHITVENNHIGNYGQIFYRSPAVLFTYVNGGQIKNNEIHDGNYTGISCGWIWFYGEHITKNINIESNLIYNVGLGMLSDLGGIYMLGVQPGSKVHGNTVHDALCYQGEGGYAGTGIYTDAGSSEMKLYNNLIFNCSTSGFNATVGRNNEFYNNIVALCGSCLANLPQNYADFVSGAYYHNNIFLTDGGVPSYSSLEQSELFKENNSVFWDLSSGKNVLFSPLMSLSRGITFKIASREKYIGENSIVADPLFKDAKNYDFELSDNSPAYSLGFEKWDYSESGTVKGTTIGIDKQGGLTPYNKNIKQCAYNEINLKFPVKLQIFFDGIIEKIVTFFNRIFEGIIK